MNKYPHLGDAVLEKITRIEVETSAERGDYTFFAIVLRDGDPPAWDVVVAAPWMRTEKKKALRYLAEKIQDGLNADEIKTIYRIVILNDEDPFVKIMHQFVRNRHVTGATIQDVTLKGVAQFQINLLYVVTSCPEGSQAERGAATSPSP